MSAYTDARDNLLACVASRESRIRLLEIALRESTDHMECLSNHDEDSLARIAANRALLTESGEGV